MEENIFEEMLNDTCKQIGLIASGSMLDTHNALMLEIKDNKDIKNEYL